MLLLACSPYLYIVADSAVPDTRVAGTAGSDERCWPDKMMPLDFRRSKFHVKMDLKYGVKQNYPDRIQWTFLVKG